MGADNAQTGSQAQPPTPEELEERRRRRRAESGRAESASLSGGASGRVERAQGEHGGEHEDGPAPHPRAPALESGHQAEVQERAALPASVVHEAIRKEGEEELKRPSSALLWSGLAAGLSMGFSLVAEGLLRAHLPEASWRPLVAKLGYSLGFLIVVLGRQQLFTENTLTVILPLLIHRNARTFFNVARLWGLVLVANLAGALVFSWAVSHSPAFDTHVQDSFGAIGREALENDFASSLVKGVFAGWLIALMVWLLPLAEAAKVFVILILTYFVGLGSFTHVIAGASETFFVAWRGDARWGDVLLRYALPTLLGNILGGVSLVAVLNHAQVVSGEEGQDV